MYSFLDGFEKRMELVGIVESIVNRKNRNMDIERLFRDNDFMNLVFSILLYIMEKTLSEDSDCDSEHITQFMEKILPEYYSLHLDINQIHQLTNYIIKNVLQNEGAPYHFQSIDYGSNARRQITIRLIADHVLEVSGGYRITYSLTDQGYDFLFRTKEVDQEIKMTIEELKLKELIKRKNFKKAHDQSLNLIQMVRQKKKELQIFMMKIKENIHDVDIDEFERLINSTYDLLNEEYDLLNDIMDMSRKSEEKIRQEYELSHHLDDSLKKAQSEIKQINYNIKAALSEQKDLILSRQSLSKVYIETIGDSFIYSMENRFSLEEGILKQMEQHITMIERFWQLVNPLFLPNVYKNMNIRSLYQPQGMLKLEEEEETAVLVEEELSEDLENIRIARVNDIYMEILAYLLRFACNNSNGGYACRLGEVIDALRAETERFNRFVEDRILFTTLLKLYDIGVVDIAQWRSNNNRVVMNLTEESNLEYCLCQLLDRYDFVNEIAKLEVIKDEKDLMEIEINRCSGEDFHFVEKIEISNFLIKVEIDHEQG